MDGLIETPARGSQFRESIELWKRLGAAWACGWELVKEKQTVVCNTIFAFATRLAAKVQGRRPTPGASPSRGTSLLVASEPGSPLPVEARLDPSLERGDLTNPFPPAPYINEVGSGNECHGLVDELLLTHSPPLSKVQIWPLPSPSPEIAIRRHPDPGPVRLESGSRPPPRKGEAERGAVRVLPRRARQHP